MQWIGWTAGIIDGEGTITIVPRKRSDGSCKCDSYMVKVMVGNTDERMIEKLVELWGGSSYHRAYDALRVNRSESWSWCVSATKAQHLLHRILPYLVTKRERAELALEMQERISGGGGFNGPANNRRSGLTPDEIQHREKLFTQMKSLNTRPGVKGWQLKNEIGLERPPRR